MLKDDAEGALLEGEDRERFVPGVFESLVGRSVGRYRILERIGDGGMAVVYRAEDESLGRVVALKFVNPSMLGRPESLERFKREARAAAAIDHPNVCPVYEINTDGARPFLAMAHLEGRTLADRLSAGKLKITAALEIAIQACRGLDAAHSKGIVHRDIKPANLMISESSTRPLVRILDFGIAQLSERSELTHEGLTVGTAAYMSPEQIDGSTVDQRTDLWALGVVLFRMIAGKLPFERATTGEMLAAIAAAAPAPMVNDQGDVPPELDAIVTKLLRKDPDARYATAAELLRELEALQARLETAEYAVRAKQARSPLPWWGWAAGAVAAVAVVAVVGFFLRSERSAEVAGEPLVPERLTAYAGAELDATISPDGTRLAFTWDGGSPGGKADAYVKLIDSESLLRITNTPEKEQNITWSPDGTRLAFIRRGAGPPYQVIVVPSIGGVETEVARIGSDGEEGLDWSPKGDFLAVDAEGIRIVSLADGSMRQISFPGEREWDECPRFSPDGERVAFWRRGRDGSYAYGIVPISGGETRFLRPHADKEIVGYQGGEFDWSPNGDALVFRGPSTGLGGPLLAVSIADARVKPTRVAELSARHIDIRGSLAAYTRQRLDTNIWELGLSADGLASGARVKRIASSVEDDSPQFSPDGREIAFSSDRSGSREIWKCNRDGGALVKLTSIGGIHTGTPRWSPDGRSIAFDATREDREPRVYLVGANGGPVRRLTQVNQREIVPSWSRDGRWVYYSSDRDGRWNIWKSKVDSGETVPVTKSGGFEAFESRDGRYLFYSERGKERTIHSVDLLSGRDEALQELGDAGDSRHWALSARGIYFVDRVGRHPNWIQLLNLETRQVKKVCEIGRLVSGPPGLAVSPDGRTLLVAQEDEREADIMLVRKFGL